MAEASRHLAWADERGEPLEEVRMLYAGGHLQHALLSAPTPLKGLEDLFPENADGTFRDTQCTVMAFFMNGCPACRAWKPYWEQVIVPTLRLWGVGIHTETHSTISSPTYHPMLWHGGMMVPSVRVFRTRAGSKTLEMVALPFGGECTTGSCGRSDPTRRYPRDNLRVVLSSLACLAMDAELFAEALAASRGPCSALLPCTLWAWHDQMCLMEDRTSGIHFPQLETALRAYRQYKTAVPEEILNLERV